MGVLDRITGPRDLRDLTDAELDELAALAAAVSGDAGRVGPDVTRRVLGVAQWALGRR